MSESNNSISSRTTVEITDDEHTFILMLRTMDLNEIFYAMKLNSLIPMELPKKYHHMTNMINVQFRKSYQPHVVGTIIEFIKTNERYENLFRMCNLRQSILEYQQHPAIESSGVYELYVKPFTTECISCKKHLNIALADRPKMLMSLNRIYRARESKFSNSNR